MPNAVAVTSPSRMLSQGLTSVIASASAEQGDPRQGTSPSRGCRAWGGAAGLLVGPRCAANLKRLQRRTF